MDGESGIESGIQQVLNKQPPFPAGACGDVHPLYICCTLGAQLLGKTQAAEAALLPIGLREAPDTGAAAWVPGLFPALRSLNPGLCDVLPFPVWGARDAPPAAGWTVTSSCSRAPTLG